jgi:hypothetical protein
MQRVVGIGLISPVGACARDHAFFVRAGATLPWPSPFVHVDGRICEVRYCPWVEGLDDVPERLVALGVAAAEQALEGLEESQRQAVTLCVCLPRAGGALTDSVLEEVAGRIAAGVRLTAGPRLAGAAGPFEALAQAREQQWPATLIVGVDSHASAAALAAREQCLPSPFAATPLPPGEGAGALLVIDPQQTGDWQVPAVGEILFSGCVAGEASDENDLPVDGAAMTEIIQGLPASGPIGSSFGQGRVDELRLREWSYAVARAAERFDPQCLDVSLEADTGATGAATGAINLAYAIACQRHETLPTRSLAPAPFVAWAISRDGIRGLALGCTEPHVDQSGGQG